MEHSPDLNKETEDFINLPTSSSPVGESKDIDANSSHSAEADCPPSRCGVMETKLEGKVLGNNELNIEHENNQPLSAANIGQDSVVSSTTLQVSIEVNESIQITENGPPVPPENGSTVQDRNSTGNNKRTGSPGSSHIINAVSGIKRPRITVDEQQASVRVVYNYLARESRQKLEELLQKWSEWHARHYSSHCQGSEGELESGEGTFYPALNLGLDKPSAVSFWMDGQTKNLQSKEFKPLDNSSIPLYDRGCSFGLTSSDSPSNMDGGLEIVDPSRCFNCGSYNHALKECPKPRDNAAVNSARKQHKTRRNQNAISRNPTRYYQDTPGGKFDGLRPGVLDPETRKLLGLGELDPPPWLNRMREIGYPPGYLDPEDEDQPSGIQIFGDEEIKQETEDGEILETDDPPEPPKIELRRKMSVEFPGVNVPIPENADEWRWGARAWNFDLPRNRSHHRSYSSREPTSRPHYHEQRWGARDYRDDGPPGVDPGSSPLVSTFSPRYSDYDSRSPSHGRNLSEASKRSPIHETSLSRDDDRWDPYSTDSSYQRKDDDRWNPHPADSSSHRKDRNEERRHHSRR